MSVTRDKYGESILIRARRIYRQLQLIEQALGLQGYGRRARSGEEDTRRQRYAGGK